MYATVTLIGVVIFVLSIVGGWLTVRRPDNRRQVPPVLLFFLYFWVYAFVQLIVVALVYWLWPR